MDNDTLIFSLFRALTPESESGLSLKTLYALLDCFGLSEEATRVALSRMYRKHHFDILKQGRSSFYRLSGTGARICARTEQRSVSREAIRAWDGRFHLLSYEIPESQRDVRQRLNEALKKAGLTRVSAGTWLSVYWSETTLRELVESAGAASFVELWQATYPGDQKALVSRLWNLESLGASLVDYCQRYEARETDSLDERACFIAYFESLHDFIAAMACVPPIPAPLLPEEWPAQRADAVFRDFRNRIRDRANAYFLSVYEPYTGEERKRV